MFDSYNQRRALAVCRLPACTTVGIHVHVLQDCHVPARSAFSPKKRHNKLVQRQGDRRRLINLVMHLWNSGKNPGRVLALSGRQSLYRSPAPAQRQGPD